MSAGDRRTTRRLPANAADDGRKPRRAGDSRRLHLSDRPSDNLPHLGASTGVRGVYVADGGALDAVTSYLSVGARSDPTQARISVDGRRLSKQRRERWHVYTTRGLRIRPRRCLTDRRSDALQEPRGSVTCEGAPAKRVPPRLGGLTRECRFKPKATLLPYGLVGVAKSDDEAYVLSRARAPSDQIKGSGSGRKRRSRWLASATRSDP